MTERASALRVDDFSSSHRELWEGHTYTKSHEEASTALQRFLTFAPNLRVASIGLLRVKSVVPSLNDSCIMCPPIEILRSTIHGPCETKG
jgi:hypothetical protein